MADARTHAFSATLFGDGMVLHSSRFRGAVLSGFAPHRRVIEMHDDSPFHTRQAYNTTADASDRWQIALDPFECCAPSDPNNFTLSLRLLSHSGSRSSAAIVATSVSFGHVFLCS